MSFAQDSGYTPVTFDQLMGAIREALNTQFGLDYTEGTFIGTNWYKYFYVLVQKVLENEVKTSEIFLKLQEYIASTNLRIQRPSVSLPGIIDSFTAYGYVASVRKTLEADAGTVAVCVDTDEDADDYPAKKLEICNLLKDFIVGGMVFIGDQTESITLSNGQEFDFSFVLPNRIAVILRLTLISSNNQEVTLPGDEEIRQIAFDNINARYRLGWDFEPQRYFTQVDAPWASSILLEWSDDDGDNWHDTIYEADFDDIYTFELEDIAVLVDP